MKSFDYRRQRPGRIDTSSTSLLARGDDVSRDRQFCDRPARQPRLRIPISGWSRIRSSMAPLDRSSCSPSSSPMWWCIPRHPTRTQTIGRPMRWSTAPAPPTSPRRARPTKCRRLIYFQTALCYGTKPTAVADPLDHPINPVNSSYAISKTAGEHYVQFSGVDWVTFRLANVIGPRNVSGPLPIFFERLSDGKHCFVTPARRDFCFAGDLGRPWCAGNRRQRPRHLPFLVRQGCRDPRALRCRRDAP